MPQYKDKPQAPHLSAGKEAEQQAESFLQQQGLLSLHRNYKCRRGELDLVMLNDDTLVFIEVRHRGNQRFGGALSSITKSKQQRVIKAAQEFLLREKVHHMQACRFDVVTVDGDINRPHIEWIPNAFDLNYKGF